MLSNAFFKSIKIPTTQSSTQCFLFLYTYVISSINSINAKDVDLLSEIHIDYQKVVCFNENIKSFCKKVFQGFGELGEYRNRTIICQIESILIFI